MVTVSMGVISPTQLHLIPHCPPSISSFVFASSSLTLSSKAKTIHQSTKSCVHSKSLGNTTSKTLLSSILFLFRKEKKQEKLGHA